MNQGPLVVKLGGSLLDDGHLARRLRAWLQSQGNGPMVLIVGGGGAADWIREAERLHKLSVEAAHRMAIRAMSFNTQLVREMLPELAYYRGGIEGLRLPCSARVLYDLADCEDVGMMPAGESGGHDGRFVDEPATSGESVAAERNPQGPHLREPNLQGLDPRELDPRELDPQGPNSRRADSNSNAGEARGQNRTARLPVGWHVTSDSIAAWLAKRLAATELVLLKSALPAADSVEDLSRSGYCDAYFRTALTGVAVVRCVNLRCEPPVEKRIVCRSERPVVQQPRG